MRMATTNQLKSTSPTHATPDRLRTVGDIARDLSVPNHRVRYAVQTCEAIKPTCRIGNYPVFGDAACALIAQRLTEISQRPGKAA